MRRSLLGLVLGFAAATSALTFLGERAAAACGGCFHPPVPPTQVASDITDERMLLAVSPTQTTLYDQIVYAGSPSAFAWVLPIHGTVTVGLSADVLFDSVDAVTATQIVPPPSICPPPPSGCTRGSGCGSASANGASFAPEGADTPGSVTVTKQQNVGPYETVQLHATDSSALDAWLQTNGFSIPADVAPVVSEYVAEGFDFLAMKLLPDVGVQSMRPVRVTMPGATVSLPLRMAAIGTGATVGITIWVVSDGRYEPENFPFFYIPDSALVWDWSTSSSNYTTLRVQNEAKLGGKGWELESSIDVAELTLSNVVLSGGQYVGPNAGYGPPSDATVDYLAVSDSDAGVGETADQVRDDDVNSLFAGMTGPNVRITRIRSDISHAAMTTDFILQASADQSEVSNIRDVAASVNEQCPLYDSCNIVGTGTPAQAVAISGKSSVGKGGCVASPQTKSGPTGRFAIVAGIGAFVVARVIRRRKRRARETR
jgi:hypothetical protein